MPARATVDGNPKTFDEKTGEWEPTQMTFGQAVEHLKKGDKVTRPGWNGKGVWLGLVPSHHEAWPGSCGGTREHLPWIGMRTADNEFVPWAATQTDLLAEDWELC